MKNSLIAIFVFGAGMAFAQRGSQQVDKPITAPVVEKPQDNGRNTTGKTDVKLDLPANKTGNGKGNKPAARTAEEYKASLNGVVHSEFGKSYAATAKAPENDEEANARISELRSNSKAGIARAEEKIEIAKNRLEELKASGEMSEADYNSKMEELRAIEKRKDSLKSSVK